MNQITLHYRLIALTIGLCAVADATAMAQDEPAPPPAGFHSEIDQAFEVQLRGPLHEAFAEPTNFDPVEPPLVDRQPPERIDELPPEYRPEGNNVGWIPGYWEFDTDLNDFLWISGMWRDAPAGRRWIPGYWHRFDNGFRRITGFWQSVNETQITYYGPPPATLEVGPSSPPPSANYFWVPGCHEYQQDQYRWRPGYWAPHQRDWIWTPACYYWTPGGYVYNQGYWDYQLPERGVPFAPVRYRGDVQRSSSVRFTPSTVLDSGSQLLLHLFVEPTRNSYVFGDYYGSQFADRGIQPWYAVQRNRGYDPLLTYYSWKFGNEYPSRLDGWHRWFNGNANYRPARTLSQQQAFVNANADFPYLQQAVVGGALADLVSSGDSRLSFTSLSADQRASVAADSQNMFGGILSQRAQTETSTQAAAKGGALAPALRLPAISPDLRIPKVGVEVPELPYDLRNVKPDLPNIQTPRVPVPGVRIPNTGVPIRVPDVGGSARGKQGRGVGGVLKGVGGAVPKVPGL